MFVSTSASTPCEPQEQLTVFPVIISEVFYSLTLSPVLQEWSKRAVEDLLAQMSLPEADAQREAEVVSTATGGRMNLERSVDAPNNLPPRERKAGCKNFYWKGFTSC